MTGKAVEMAATTGYAKKERVRAVSSAFTHHLEYCLLSASGTLTMGVKLCLDFHGILSPSAGRCIEYKLAVLIKIAWQQGFCIIQTFPHKNPR